MHRRWLVALAVLAAMRSLVLGVVTPPYQSSDEPWHLDYARSVAAGHLPELGRTRLDGRIVAHDKRTAAAERLTLYGIDTPPMSREASQPPLGYLLPALGWKVSSSAPGALRWFRVVDALAGIALAWVAFAAARRLFPGSPHAGPLAGLTAVFLPSIAIVSSTANNDAAAAVVAVAAIGWAGVLARRGGSPSRYALLGALVGLAALTKASGLLLVAPAAVAIALAPAPSSRARVVSAAAFTGVVAVVVAPWLVRNSTTYGDLLGSGGYHRFPVVPGRAIGGWGILLGARPALAQARPFWPELARTSVGVLRWADLPLPLWTYLVGAVAALAATVAVARWLVRATGDDTSGDRRVAAVAAAALVAYVGGAAVFAMTVDYQPQGRYLLPAVLGITAVAGAAVGRRGFVAVTGVLVVLFGAAVATSVSTFGLP